MTLRVAGNFNIFSRAFQWPFSFKICFAIFAMGKEKKNKEIVTEI